MLHSVVPSIIPDSKITYITLYYNKRNPYEQIMVFICPPGVSIPNMKLPAMTVENDVAVNPQLTYDPTKQLFGFKIPIYISEGKTGMPLIRIKYYINGQVQAVMDQFRISIGKKRPYHFITRKENYDQARPLGHIWPSSGGGARIDSLSNGKYKVMRCSTGCIFNTYQQDKKYNYQDSRNPPLRKRRLPITNVIGPW